MKKKKYIYICEDLGKKKKRMKLQTKKRKTKSWNSLLVSRHWREERLERMKR